MQLTCRTTVALIELYKRLTKRRKTHKSALVACARKLLVFANTVVHRGTPWQDTAALSAS
jgi:transposase